MKFWVGLGGVKVSDKIYRGLEKINEHGFVSSEETSRDKDIIEAFDWLNNNIRSGDAFDWEYEVVDIEE